MKRRIQIIVGAGVVLLLTALLLSATRSGGGTWTTGLLLAGGLAWTIAVVVSWRSITHYITRRSTRYGLNAILLSFLVLVILIMFGFIADRHGIRRDMTSTGEFSLSQKSLNVLQGLKKRVDIYVYYERSQRGPIRDLLMEYTRRNRGIRFHIEDLNKDPELAERFQVRELGTMVFDAGDKTLRLQTFGEEDITNALIKVSRPGAKNVYFLTNHGEKEIAAKGVFGYSIAAEAMKRENYNPQTLSLTTTGGVPEDCDVLVLAGAKSKLLDQEALAVQRYLQRGGRLLCLFDPRFMSGLEGYVSVWGIEVGNDRVVDPSPMGQLLGRGPTTPLVNKYGVHDITKQFRQPTYFQNVRSVKRQKLYTGKAETTALLWTSERSWADRDVTSRQVSFDPEDLPGPVSIGMTSRLDVKGLHPELESAVSIPDPGAETVDRSILEGVGQARFSEARLVVFGDSDFVANNNFNDMGNGNLFLNALAWLAEDEDLIAVRPKSTEFRSVSLTKGQIKLLNIISLAVLPGLFAIIGTIATLRRRARG